IASTSPPPNQLFNVHSFWIDTVPARAGLLAMVTCARPRSPSPFVWNAPMELAAHTTSTIIPCLRYRNAPAAIEWLCTAFGFQRQAVYQDGDIVHHAA